MSPSSVFGAEHRSGEHITTEPVAMVTFVCYLTTVNRRDRTCGRNESASHNW